VSPAAPDGTGPRIVAITGGVGGAKLGLGLTRILDAARLDFVVNTGDDFEHHGLHVSPDLDTLLYTLSGEADAERGWGRRGETWNFLDALRAYGGEDWFSLGDRDLATHVLRTEALRRGETLTAVTARLGAALGVGPRMLPMSDDPVRTVIGTADGKLAFQHYFVRERCEPAVTGFRFEGAERARLPEAVREALAAPDLDAVVICPSNPFVSVDPVLAVPGMRAALAACAAPVVAVSPIVDGLAIKGPTAKMMDELGVPRTATAVAAHYGARADGGILDGFLLDASDAQRTAEVRALGLVADAAPSVMVTLDDRIALARAVLAFAEAIPPRR
jgi:LPPG:FO 2-phospho-L-lactate transferase